MAPALDRFSSVLVGWVPDLSRLPPRRQVAMGGLLALLFHLLLLPLALLLMIVGDLVFPHRPEAPLPETSSLEVEIAPSKPETAPLPSFEDRRTMFDPRGMQASEKPKDARLQSDRDMSAGTEKPPTGLLPLPSQEGREDRPTNDFATQDVQLSAKDNSAAAAAVTAPPSPPVEAPSAPPPLYKPQPVTAAALAAAAAAPPDQKLPDPAKIARATPPPLERVVMLRQDQIALIRPPEATKPAPITKAEPAHTEPNQNETATAATPVPRSQPPQKKWMPMMSTPKPLVPLASTRYQESLERTHVDGAISNRGPVGVDAIATPEGRWWMMTKTAIQKNWYLFLDQRRDLLSTGSVRISFTIDEEGKVHGIHMEAGSGNRSLDEVCLQAIRETDIPPPPKDAFDPLPNGQMDQEINFNYY